MSDAQKFVYIYTFKCHQDINSFDLRINISVELCVFTYSILFLMMKIASSVKSVRLLASSG